MPYLPDGLKNPYPSVRIAIAEAIGAAVDGSARQLLIPLLEDRNQAVTIAAVLALAGVGAAEDAACLTHLLTSELEETRLAAVSALRGLGVFCIVDTLAELAQSESPAVRATVARVLSVAPGHDTWVMGDEVCVFIEFDFERDTVQRLGLPEKHCHD